MGHDRRGDRARLRRVHGLAEERYDAIVERFYALLEQDPVASEALPPTNHRAGLKRAMKEHFRGLLMGERDGAWAESRVRLATQHVRSGVPFSIYVRSFAAFQDALGDVLEDMGHVLSPGDDRALTRAILADIGIVLDAGEEARRRAEEEAACARERAEALRAREQAARMETVQRLAAAAEFRDTDTGNHVVRMSEYAALLARVAGRPCDEVEALRVAASMHDLGKIGIPDAILLKPGPLTAAEWEVMRTYAELGHQLLADSESPLLQLGAEVALTHHERWDGGGYPQGLAGAAIPLVGRIVAVADVFDALTSRRVYKEAHEVGAAVAELVERAGSHFDPTLVDLFVQNLPEVLGIRARYRD